MCQRSGAPGQPSGGRAAGHKQPRFTRGVKRHAHRAGPAPCTVCPALTGVCVPEAVARSPPGPPQLAGQAFSRHKGSPSTRCCVGGAPGVEGVCSLRLCKGRQSAERSGRRRVGCHLSVSVSCRTRSRRPTVFRPLPENSDKGKDVRIWGVVCRCQLYSAPAFEKSMAQTPVFCLGRNSRFSTQEEGFVCKK